MAIEASDEKVRRAAMRSDNGKKYKEKKEIALVVAVGNEIEREVFLSGAAKQLFSPRPSDQSQDRDESRDNPELSRLLEEMALFLLEEREAKAVELGAAPSKETPLIAARILALFNEKSQRSAAAALIDGAPLRQVESALKSALAWHEAIFEGSNDAIFISDADSRFVAVNQAAVELTGYSREDLLKLSIPDLHEEADLGAYRLFHDRILAGERIVSEALVLRKDGSKVSVEFNNRAIEINGEQYMHTTARDVSERKGAEAALQQAQVRFAQAESMHRLTQGLAHEVRNPLFAIKLNVAALERRMDNYPDIKPFLAHVKDHSERLDMLMQDLIELARPVAPEEFDTLDLRDVVHTALLLVEESTLHCEHRLVFDEPERPFRLRGASRRLTIALTHLIANAVQNSPPESKISIILEESEEGYAIMVVDAGSGISEKLLASIGEPFVTAHQGRRGLGLALVRHYVSAHGGTLIATNNPDGRGATFTISLPRNTL